MARQETDREDLFREATALVRRVELDIAGVIVVAGFRRSTDGQAIGSLSIYNGPDFVLNFNDVGELRRAYHDGFIYRAEPGRKLTRLRRERDPSTSTLFASEMSEPELNAFIARAQASCADVLQSTQSGTAAVLRSEPPDDAAAILRDIHMTLQRIVDSGPSISDGM